MAENATVARPLWQRTLLTLVWLAVALLAAQVPLPMGDGIDPSGPFALRLLQLGITPALSCFVIVEIVAVAHPGWRRRRDEPALRSKLTRAALVLSMLTAASQAWGLCLFLNDGVFGAELPVLPTVASLTAGHAALLGVAAAITRLGRLNGIVALAALDFWVSGAPSGGVRNIDLSMGSQVGLQLAAAVVLLLLVWGVVGSVLQLEVEPTVAQKSAPYRGRQQVPLRVAMPLVASGLLPLSMTFALIRVPSTLQMWVPGLEGWNASLLPALVVLAGLTLVFAMAFTPITDMSKELARLTGTQPSSAAMRRARWRVAAASVGVMTAVFCGDWMLVELGQRAWILPLVLGLALLADARSTSLAERELGALVVLGETRRPHLAVLRATVLAQHGYSVHLHGLATGILHTFWGPYAPVLMLAPPNEAEEIEDALAVGFEPDERGEATQGRSLWRATRYQGGLLGAGAIVALALALAPSFLRDRVQGNPVRFELLEVDDGVELASDLNVAELPHGFDLQQEGVAAADGDTRWVNYVSVMPSEAETPAQSLKRAQAWARTLELPPGREVIWMRQSPALPDPVVFEDDLRLRHGWRSLVVRSGAIVTQQHVVDVRAVHDPSAPYGPEASVSIYFDDVGAKAFSRATSQLVQRRIAIVVNGQAQSAPTVQAPITGGVVSVTASSEEQARELAASLRVSAGNR